MKTKNILGLLILVALVQLPFKKASANTVLGAAVGAAIGSAIGQHTGTHNGAII